MFRMLLLTVLGLVATTHQLDPIMDQLSLYMQSTNGQIPTLTTSSGMPVESSYVGSTLNKNLMANPFFMDYLTHFIRENIPERIVHMKGAGAFGFFETTHDVSNICAADFLNTVGKKTPLVARFSVGVTGKGGPDTSATPMGFALKFYTEEGNLDLLGLNFPMFTMKDPLRFPSFIHIMKKNPVTNMADPNMFWDYATSHPECLNMVMMIYGDRGIPYSYRHMPGYPVHTFQVYNAKGETHHIRFHILPVEGLKFMNATQAASLAGSNPDYYSGDLRTNIANGNFPKWNVSIQILTDDDVKNAGFDVHDTSKFLPIDKYPLHPVGTITLDKNPTNYFQQIEMLALNPAHLVPYIQGSSDKMFEARRIFYSQAQSYRLGVNYNNIEVNCPFRSKINNYNRDGRAPLNGNGKDAPNYHPNSFNGSEAYTDKNIPPLITIVQDEPDNLEQGKDYAANQMTSEERARLAQTLSSTLCYATNNLQEKAVTEFTKINAEIGQLMAKALTENNCKH